MANYEFIMIFTQDTGEQKVRAIVSELTDAIKAAGGNVTKTEFCGIRTFAYPIQKMKKGYYILVNMIAEPAFLKDLYYKIKQETHILRHLIIKVKELNPNPSAMLQQRHNLDLAYKTQIRSGKAYTEEYGENVQ